MRLTVAHPLHFEVRNVGVAFAKFRYGKAIADTSTKEQALLAQAAPECVHRVTQSETMQELPRPNPAVLFQPVSEGAVLLNPEQEIYFGLNEVGAEIWQLLPPANTQIDALCAGLASKYPGVEESELKADVIELLEALQAEGLVVPASADAG